MLMKKSRPWTPGQTYLLPPSPHDWLPEGHLVYFILDVIEELDLSEIESAALLRDPRGVQPYAPAMMVALLLWPSIGHPPRKRGSPSREHSAISLIPTAG